jgi:hypothetical protein
MTSKSRLIGGAALGALLIAGAAAPAIAKTAKHKSSGASASQADLQAEVQLLKSEVGSLENRLNAQDEAQKQAQAQVQAAQAQAAQAQAQAQAAQQQVQAQIETIPNTVDTAVKAAVPKPGWEANTTLGGTIFANVSNIDNTTAGTRTAQSGTDFQLKRAYLIVDHKFSNFWAADITTDATYDSVTGATQLFIKKAYLQGKVSDAFIFRAGASDLPWVPFMEKLYGYRYVEKLMIDRTNFGTTTDWGLHAFGTFDNGIFGYQVSVVDGNGFKKPSMGVIYTNPTVSGGGTPCCQTANVDVEARVNATYKGFTAAVGGYDGYLGKAVVGYPYYNSAQRFDAVVGYGDDRFRLYGEYFWANDWNNVTTAPSKPTTTSQGYSIFGSFNFSTFSSADFVKDLAVFARYDWVQPATTTQSRFTDNYYNIGLAYTAFKGIDLALVYKHEPVYNNILATSNGNIGGVWVPVPPNSTYQPYGTYNEIGVFSQVKF